MKNIIVVDMQKGFINKNNEELVNKINRYLSNNHFDNIIYTKYINFPGSPFIKFLDWTDLQDKGSQQIAVDVKDGSKIFEKAGYGIDDKIIKYLKSKNITECEVCGTNSDACVMAVAFNLFDNDIKPIIIYDLCGTNNVKKIDDCAKEIFPHVFPKSDINNKKW